MTREADHLAWFKSTYSDGPEGDSCVEVATAPAVVHVRDSKNPEGGPTFRVASAVWTEFVAYASAGQQRGQ
ncbi:MULTISPECIES: DUF397 domain-containing protein [Streptomyces]|uniref:DUF397 domain-containing protein n=1 Tax=Streptomyces TaxID=1883 RepID=UPI0029B53E75|nr:DUF397 domain-containing protein [Streptomyces scabiei]MDX3114379.1 DUF397 domain-containing protein [Streptomyces scabiei]